jgi:hypothetical protein
MAGLRYAGSMLRERGANDQCRCGQPNAAAGTRPRWGGADWRQADSRWVWRQSLRARVVIASGPQGRCGRGGCLATIRIGLDHFCASAGSGTAAVECPLVVRVV